MEHTDDPVIPDEVKCAIVLKPKTHGRNNFIQLLKDPAHRRKLLQTLWICFAFVTLGWIIGQRGPSFLDVQLITDVDVEKGSAFFTAGSIGYILGSFVGGILLDMFNHKMILFLTTISLGALTAAIPWCVNYWWMIVLQVLSGMSAGVLDTGGNALTARIWRNQVKHYMQAVHFSFAFGGVISPLVTKPYLATVHVYDNNTNKYDAEVEHGNIWFNNTNFSISATSGVQTSLLYIPFSLSGVLAFLSAIPLLYEWCSDRRHLHRFDSTYRQTVVENNPPKIPIFLKMVTIYLIGQLFLFYCSVEDSTAGFLVTFVVQQLSWSKQKGADLTALFWGSFALGRFSGIFVVKIFHSVKIILLCCTCITVSYIGLYMGTIFYIEPVIWLFTGMVGASMSFVFPCLFTWTEEDIIPVTAKMSSFFLIMSAGGASVTPLLMGYTMEEYTPLYFLYILFIESVLVIITFVVLWLLVHFKIKAIVSETKKRSSIEELEIIRTRHDTLSDTQVLK